MTKIYNIQFLSVAFFILVGMGTFADAAVLPPSPGFVSLTNPTGRPECIVLPNNCIGSGNPSAGFTSLTNPTGRPECIVLPNNCIGSDNPSAGFTSLTNPTGRPECIVLPSNCTAIPTINPQIPVTADVAISTSLGTTSAFRVDLPATLDIPATLGLVSLTTLVDPTSPSMKNQTITNPEPTTLLLLGSGLSGLFLIRKLARRRPD